MNPVSQLELVAKKLAHLGEADLATRVREAATRVAAANEVVLDSWAEFETWLLKNRSQGLEFTFEDKYGADSPETAHLRQWMESYDAAERQAHELYEMLKQETPAPAEESVADDVEAVDTEAAEAMESADTAEGEAEESEMTAEDILPEEEEAATEEEGAEEEEASAAEEAAEEAFAPSKAASAVTPESKMIHRLTKMMTK